MYTYILKPNIKLGFYAHVYIPCCTNKRDKIKCRCGHMLCLKFKNRGR